MSLSAAFKKTYQPTRRYDQKFKPTSPRHSPRMKSSRRRRYPRPKR